MKFNKDIRFSDINLKKLIGSLLLVLYVVFCFIPHKPGNLLQAIFYPLLGAIAMLIAISLSVLFLVVFGSLTAEFLYGIWLLVKPAFKAYWNWIQKEPRSGRESP